MFVLQIPLNLILGAAFLLTNQRLSEWRCRTFRILSSGPDWARCRKRDSSGRISRWTPFRISHRHQYRPSNSYIPVWWPVIWRMASGTWFRRNVPYVAGKTPSHCRPGRKCADFGNRSPPVTDSSKIVPSGRFDLLMSYLLPKNEVGVVCVFEMVSVSTHYLPRMSNFFKVQHGFSTNWPSKYNETLSKKQAGSNQNDSKLVFKGYRGWDWRKPIRRKPQKVQKTEPASLSSSVQYREI